MLVPQEENNIGVRDTARLQLATTHNKFMSSVTRSPVAQVWNCMQIESAWLQFKWPKIIVKN